MCVVRIDRIDRERSTALLVSSSPPLRLAPCSAHGTSHASSCDAEAKASSPARRRSSVQSPDARPRIHAYLDPTQSTDQPITYPPKQADPAQPSAIRPGRVRPVPDQQHTRRRHAGGGGGGGKGTGPHRKATHQQSGSRPIKQRYAAFPARVGAAAGRRGVVRAGRRGLHSGRRDFGCVLCGWGLNALWGLGAGAGLCV